jgi:glycosyltransferase involved in cell wall biosynthesis
VLDLPVDKEIIVVNDGSTDSTAQSLQALKGMPNVRVFTHEVNRGKGAALQTGFGGARGRLVVIQDADLEYDPQDILRVIQPLQAGQADVVFGSRYLDNPQQDPSSIHRLGNWGLTTLSNLFSGYRLTDMETCYKAFRREVLSSITIEQQRFGFEPEITMKLAKRKIPIQEVGISYSSRSRKEGKKIGWRDLFNAIYCIVRYSWR